MQSALRVLFLPMFLAGLFGSIPSTVFPQTIHSAPLIRIAPSSDTNEERFKSSIVAGAQSAQSQFPRSVHHCCHLKGFVIGASVGGILESMALFGGIGAAIGAFLQQPNTVPIVPLQPALASVRVRVSPVFTGRLRAATA